MTKFFIVCAALIGSLPGCGGLDSPQTQEIEGPLCELRGTYEFVTDGCGYTTKRLLSSDYSTECNAGDVCDPGTPSTFCSFVLFEDAGCRYTMTATLVQ